MSYSREKNKKKISEFHAAPLPEPNDAMMSGSRFAKSIRLDQIRGGLEEPALRLLASAAVMAVVQKELKKHSHDATALIMIVGGTSTGKSPSAKAMLPDAQVVPMNSTNRTFRAYFDGYELGYAICDDIFPTSSQLIQNRFAANTQDCARFCYDGSWPVIIVTAEPGVEKYLSGSARSRTFLFYLEPGIRDHTYSEKLRFFQDNPDWRRLLSKFGAACESSDEYFPPDYLEEIRAFRQRYESSGLDPKAVNMIFGTLYALRALDRYVQSISGKPLMGDRMLADTEKMLISCSARDAAPEVPLEEKILEQVLQKDYFTPQHPYPKNLCERYLQHGITCCDQPDFFNPPCDDCFQCKLVPNVYDPTELVYRYDGTTNALLLDDQTSVYQYLQRSDPVAVLIVDSDLLLTAMNAELQLWHREHNERCLPFTAQRLHKRLFALNRSMAIPTARDRYRHQFEYPCEIENQYKRYSVSVLLLKESEAAHLADRCPKQILLADFPARRRFIDNIPDIAGVLQHKFAQAQHYMGPIGVSPLGTKKSANAADDLF